MPAATDSNEPLVAGARVDKYVVREQIGNGATAVVYEAEHRTLGHRVAIKVLRPELADRPEIRRRFVREMRLCGKVESLHVPHVHDVGELPDGLPYIVMERLSGSSLADWLAVHRRLPVAVVVEIGVQLCAALNALHAAGAVHRDVKPENVVLHRDNSGAFIVKLVDFGICKELDEDVGLTVSGTVVGTPEYMSPEQVQGLFVDERTDVYSVGVLLYELLTGHTPFEGSDPRSVAHAVLSAEPRRIHRVRPDVPRPLERAVMQAMARDRDLRQPSADAFRRELERIADEQALRRHPRVWRLLPSVSSPRLGLALPATETGAFAEQETEPSEEAIRLPMRNAPLGVAAALAIAGFVAAVGAIGYYAVRPVDARAAEASASEREGFSAQNESVAGNANTTPVNPAAPAASHVPGAVPANATRTNPAAVDTAPSPASSSNRPASEARGSSPSLAPSPAAFIPARAIATRQASASGEDRGRRPAGDRRHEPSEGPVTTVAAAPIAPVSIGSSSLRAADLYAQMGAPAAVIETPASDDRIATNGPPRNPYQ